MGSHYTDLGILAVWVAWFQKRSHYLLPKRCMEWADIIPLSPILNKNIYKVESESTHCYDVNVITHTVWPSTFSSFSMRSRDLPVWRKSFSLHSGICNGTLLHRRMGGCLWSTLGGAPLAVLDHERCFVLTDSGSQYGAWSAGRRWLSIPGLRWPPCFGLADKYFILPLIHGTFLFTGTIHGVLLQQEFDKRFDCLAPYTSLLWLQKRASLSGVVNCPHIWQQRGSLKASLGYWTYYNLAWEVRVAEGCFKEASRDGLGNSISGVAPDIIRDQMSLSALSLDGKISLLAFAGARFVTQHGCAPESIPCGTSTFKTPAAGRFQGILPTCGME